MTPRKRGSSITISRIHAPPVMLRAKFVVFVINASIILPLPRLVAVKPILSSPIKSRSYIKYASRCVYVSRS